MNSDIRISTGFFENHKTRRLQSVAGSDGVVCLLKLWVWASKYRPDGILENMNGIDIETVSGWTGKRGVFFSQLIDLQLINSEPTTDNESLTTVQRPFNEPFNEPHIRYSIHDWREHNPWAAESENRSNKARLSRLAYVAPLEHSKLIKKGVNSITKTDYETIMAKTRMEKNLSDRKNKKK